MADKCGGCGHARHPRRCRAKAGSGCQPLLDDAGRQVGFACGARPRCPCAWQDCKCGLPVAVAALDGTGLDTAVVRGSAGNPGGTLAVRLLPDGTLRCREIRPGDPLRPGEYRGVEHLEWPDHGPVAASCAPAGTGGAMI